MYSMFMKALIELAPENCLIGFITLNSFLTAKGHADLRDLIQEKCTIHNIHLCPTDLFRSQGADVRTCILILQKGKNALIQAKTSNRPTSTNEFLKILNGQKFSTKRQSELSLHGPSDLKEFIIGVPEQVFNLFEFPRVGELFPCITGISTGNDKKFIKPKEEKGFSIPFYKNPGSRRFYTQPDGYLPDDFLDIEKAIPNFMVRNKSLLFKGGIACSSMGVDFNAAYLPNGATVGVNANIIVEDDNRWWLLGYLNSSLCSYLVRGILIRSNMITSGYVSRIPIPSFSEEDKDKIAQLAHDAYAKKLSAKESSEHVSKIDDIIFSSLGFSEKTVLIIKNFVSDIVFNS